MPQRERTAPPSPWPPIAEIPPDDFALTPEQRAELIGLLPERLAQLGTPPVAAPPGCGMIRELTMFLPPELAGLDCSEGLPTAGCKSIAELIVQACAEHVQSYRSAERERQKHPVPANPANVARAVNDLVVALRPFVSGSVDLETMRVVGAVLRMPPEAAMSCLATLKNALAEREKAVRALRVSGEERRELMGLCGMVGITLRQFAEANGAPMTEAAQARFLDRLLTFAGMPHPGAEDNPKRLIALLHS